jgi:hypothetical protein
LVIEWSVPELWMTCHTKKAGEFVVAIGRDATKVDGPGGNGVLLMMQREYPGPG